MAAVVDRARERLRAQALASDARAGVWSAGEARRLAYGFARANWRRYLVVLAGSAVAMPMVLVLPSWSRGMAIGAWLASIMWMLTLWTILASGAGSRVMGEAGEQWTAQVLRRLRRRGWRIANHMMHGPGDIDHLAVGPGGLVIVETKWTSQRCGTGQWPTNIESAAGVAATRANEIRLTLKRSLGTAPVHTAVVVWGPEVLGADGPTFDRIRGSEIVPGEAFGGWLDRIPDAGITVDAIHAAWTRIDSDVRRGDKRDVSAAHPTAASELLRSLVSGLLSGCAGVIALGYLVDERTGWLRMVASVASLACIGVVARRVGALRLAATGWLAGVGGSTLVAAIYACFLVVTG